jgi:hypothetical protein
MDEGTTIIHPRWLRQTHWLNALAVVVLAMVARVPRTLHAMLFGR